MVKGRAQAIPPLVIVAWTQTVAALAWLVFFAVSGHPLAWSRAAWPAIVALSGVVAVLLGRTLFGEADLGRRLAAALLACAGAACVLFAR